MTGKVSIQDHRNRSNNPRKQSKLRILQTVTIFLFLVFQLGIILRQHSSNNYGIQANFLSDISQNLHFKMNDKDVMHVLFCLSGNSPGFFEEFKVALKSVLMNSPSGLSLSIHVMADEKASEEFDAAIFDTGVLDGWRTRNPVLIHKYDVSNYVPEWRDWADELAKMSAKTTSDEDTKFAYVHTVGQIFRLFADEVLRDIEPQPQHVLYLDTDVVVMANLQNIWSYADSNAIFQWGQSQCSGFMLLNLRKLEGMRNKLKDLDLASIKSSSLDLQKHHFDDQFLFIAVNNSMPEQVSILPDEWDISIANGIWRMHKDIVEKRPNIGMIHFNGGSASTNAFFDEHSFYLKYNETFGLVKYYVKLPWPWAKFIVESNIESGEGYLINIV